MIAACVALLLWAAVAPVAKAANVTSQASTGAFTVDTTHDLLIGQTLSSVSYNVGSTGSSGQSGYGNANSGLLTDGSFGSTTPSGNPATVATIGTGYVIVYNLNTTLNPGGYNIGEIDTYGGWNDNGRDQQAYTVDFELVGGSTFVSAATVSYNPPGATTPSNSLVKVTELNLAGLAIQAVRFTFNTQENTYAGYRELVVKGTPVTVTTQTGAGTFTVDTTNDLLIGSTLFGATYTGTYTFSGGDAVYANASTGTVLYDGSFGANPPSSGPTTVAPIATGDTITYTFNTAANPLGFNLSEIDVYGGWNDSGRDTQAYTVAYQPLGGGAFVEIATLSLNPAGTTPSNTAVAITNLGISSIAVQAVEFTFGIQENGYCGYREIVVKGTTIPVPTATWVGGTSSDWGDGTNWNPAGVPANNAVLTFGSTGANPTVDLGTASRTAAGITFVTNVSTTIGSTGGNSLTLDNSTFGTTVAVTGTHAISAAVVLNSNATFSVASGGQMTVSGIVSEGNPGRAVSMSGGTGLLILSGANTYTGPTNINSGTVQADVAQNGTTSGPFGTNGTITFVSGILQYTNLNNFDYSPRFATTLQAIGVDTNGQTVTWAAALMGSTAGSLTLNDSAVTKGSLTLGGANAFTGPITVNGGTLKAASSTALGGGVALTLAASTKLDLNGNSCSITSVNANSTVNITDNSAGTGTSVLTITNQSPTIPCLIADGPTRFVGLSVSNPLTNTQVLTNNNNTFSGGLLLANSTGGGTRLNPPTGANGNVNGSAGAIINGPYGRGPITIGAAATDKAAIFFQNSNCTIVNDIVCNTILGDDFPGGFRVDGTGTVLAGKITANLASASFSSIAGTGGSVTLTGQVTGNSGVLLINSYGAVLTVTLNNSASSNNYVGDTSVGVGNILQLGAANQIPDGAGSGNLIVNGAFKLAGFSETVNGLNGGGSVDGVSGTPTFTVGGVSATGTFSGVISNSAGILTLVKTGSGT